jgi:hypothetical protein
MLDLTWRNSPAVLDIIVINRYNDRYGKGRGEYAAQAKTSFFPLFVLGHKKKGG